MDLKAIQEILKFINKSELTDVEIEQKDFRLRVQRRSPENVIYAAPQVSAAPVQQVQAPVAPQTPATPQPQTEAPAAEKSAEAPAADSKLIEFKSPMIGTFYRSSSPDSDPFVKVGDTVTEGQTLCIIEAMKLFNEIESDVEGKIVKILVENAQPVEYDQPLFLIEPTK